MKTMTWDNRKPYLEFDGMQYKCWSHVRNEINKERPRPQSHDICISINKDGTPGVPIMPRPFPCGEWKITGFKEHPDPLENHGYLYPVFIRTNAVNLVPEWRLDENGFYLEPTGRIVEDYYNGLHFSTSWFTQGCIRIATETEVRLLWHSLSIDDTFIVTD
jgi:hypothetical protein